MWIQDRENYTELVIYVSIKLTVSLLRHCLCFLSTEPVT